MNNGIAVLSGKSIKKLICGKEQEIISIVKTAYSLHYEGKTSLPQSVFLRFPERQRDRIIALPSYIKGESEVAGIKWISSFPNNIEKGVDRASATVILNSMENGRAFALLEGAQISSNRTAASAALAAKYLHKNKEETTVGLIGTGLINFTILRYLVSVFSKINKLYIYDLNLFRSKLFKKQVEEMYGNKFGVTIYNSYEDVLRRADLISFATTSSKPYINDTGLVNPNMTILHVSLRDLSEEIILGANNIVDDIDHVCRAETSIHLTEKAGKNRNFINGVLAECFNNNVKMDLSKATIFSPFGLGMLDISLSQYLYEQAVDQNMLTFIDDFYD